MLPLDLVITSAGLDALVDAENGDTDPIVITQVGLSETAVDAAPTLTALTGEFKRLDSVSGESVAANVIHMTAMDPTEDVYDLRAIALYLSDGTLFAAYGQEDPIFTKVSIADFLLAFDVAFSGDIAGGIEFGDASFLYPPATETVKGVAELATQDETDTGTDDERIVTPLKLNATLGAAIALLTGRTITGGDLATGGGDLSANRTLTVTAATGSEIATGTESAKAVTPAAIASVPQSFGSSVLGLGGAITKMGAVIVDRVTGASVTFAVAFPNACDRVLISPAGNVDDGDENDENCWTGAITASGFSIISDGADGNNASFAWVAFGH